MRKKQFLKAGLIKTENQKNQSFGVTAVLYLDYPLRTTVTASPMTQANVAIFEGLLCPARLGT